MKLTKSKLKEIIREEIQKLKEGYQGWKNWDTWNANLHLTNDESAYNQYMKLKNAKSIKSFFISNFGKGFDRINVNKVDWEEIYDAKDE